MSSVEDMKVGASYNHFIISLMVITMEFIVFCIIFLEIIQMSKGKAREPTTFTTTTPTSTTAPSISSSLGNSSIECKYQRKKCPFDVDVNFEEEFDDAQLNRLFPGLFQNISSYQNIMLPFGGDIGILVNHTIVKTRGRQPIIKPRQKRNEACCQTKHQAIIPLTVDFNDKQYNVQHGKDNYQIVYTGFCSHESDTTITSGLTCRTIDIYHWILIEDLELTYDPPVKFIPVKFQGFCSCLNIG